MAKLMDFIQPFSGDGGSLPLIHSTDGFILQKMRESGEIRTNDDKVYPGERLLYMFYGRPSYRVNAGVEHTTVSFFAPICMIFDRSLINQAWRIMPFDTGAHHSGRLSETIHRSMDLTEFALEVSTEAPMKLIRCFYGNEDNYASSNPFHNEPDIEQMQRDQHHYPEAYFQLLHHRPNTGLDERVSAIEVQFNNHIQIRGNCSAVILPSRYFNKKIISQIETEFGATCISYDSPSLFKPANLMNTIYEKVQWYLAQTR